MPADLHVHTSCSDGLEDPERVVDAAIAVGLDHLAVTDHDTLEGYLRARRYLATLEPSPALTLVPGIEVSTSYEGRDVHVLGYYLESLSSELSSRLTEIRERRARRALTTADKLSDAGYPVSSDDLRASGATVNRTALARLLVARGVVPDTGAAFKLLIGRGTTFYTPRDDIPTVHAVELIAAAGGIPVVAHPALYHVEDLIPLLVEHGLRGIEAFHSEQTPQQSAELLEIAERWDLLVTGGSDWHQDPVHPARIGEVSYPREYLERFLAADPRRQRP